ncbi:hypothetical protein PHMEG_00012791 [Phytophthora megakarya]|uniref:Uncharacterized protein n=1 Tax=Phytophthora megakarya TaxID=4795 RepID=A0A225W7V1_9STRA|nr:hypothetical protein PHMEG_00012791 [Phytophthora megakarya]
MVQRSARTPRSRARGAKAGEARRSGSQAKRRRQNRNFFPSSDDSSSSETGTQRRKTRLRPARSDVEAADVEGEDSSSSGGDSGRDVGEVVAREEEGSVPPLDVRSFDNWKALETYLKSYNRRTYQIYSVRTGTPARTRNAKIKSSSSCCDEIPIGLEFYNKNYQCTHAGSPR